jgi:hypothetical protein
MALVASNDMQLLYLGRSWILCDAPLPSKATKPNAGQGLIDDDPDCLYIDTLTVARLLSAKIRCRN